MHLKKRVKKECENGVKLIRIIIIVCCIGGCIFEIGRSLHKLLTWKTGTDIEVIHHKAKEAEHIRQDLRFAFCIQEFDLFEVEDIPCKQLIDESFKPLQPACEAKPFMECLLK